MLFYGLLFFKVAKLYDLKMVALNSIMIKTGAYLSTNISKQCSCGKRK